MLTKDQASEASRKPCLEDAGVDSSQSLVGQQRELNLVCAATYLLSSERAIPSMTPPLEGSMSRHTSLVERSHEISRLEMDTTYFLSEVREQPKIANSWPSREYLSGPPGESRQCLHGAHIHLRAKASYKTEFSILQNWDKNRFKLYSCGWSKI